LVCWHDYVYSSKLEALRKTFHESRNAKRYKKIKARRQ